MIRTWNEFKFYAHLASMLYNKALNRLSMFFLFFGLMQAILAPLVLAAPLSVTTQCRSYFVLTDVLQKLSSEEYASLVVSAEMLGRLVGKTDATSQDAKAALNQQLVELIASKHFSKEESKYFISFLIQSIEKNKPTSQQTQQELEKKRLQEQQIILNNIQTAKLRSILPILNKYETQDINVAFYLSCHKNSFNNKTTNIQEIVALLHAGADRNYRHTEHSEFRGQTALMGAIENRETAVVQFLIDIRADMEVPDLDGRTALARASIRSVPISFIELLIKAGANVDAKSDEDATPLIYAAREQVLDLVELLIKAGATLDSQNKNGDTALIIASQNRDTAIIIKLLQAGANPNLANNSGDTAFLLATGHNHIAAILSLMQAQANPHAFNKQGLTALMIASRNYDPQNPNGNDKIVEDLLALHARVDATAENRKTALMYAIEAKDTKVIQLLMAAKADLDIQGENGNTALMLAVIKRQTAVVKDLLQAGANVHIKNHEGNTAFTLAVSLGSAEILKLLIEAKSDLNTFNKNGETAVMWAVTHNESELLQTLVDAKADVNICIGKYLNNTALMKYVRQYGRKDKPDLSILKILIAAKANPYIKDQFGKTALQLAEHPAIIKLLQEYQDSLSWTESMLAKLHSRFMSFAKIFRRR